MPVPVTDLQQPNISNIIELFELELNTAMHGANNNNIKYIWNDNNNSFDVAPRIRGCKSHKD